VSDRLEGPRLGSILAALVALCVPGAFAFAVEIQRHQWGFDGRVVANRVNPLVVRVSNPTGRPFRGRLVLEKTLLGGGRLGAALVQDCYISPHAARWVRFYPYVEREYERWRLSWSGRAGSGSAEEGSVLLPELNVGRPARVMLVDPDSVLPLPSGFRSFAANLFPPTVAATDGLASVVLDHAPRWPRVQRQAFMDWLSRGGTLHILFDPSGEHPVFADEMEPLNNPVGRFRVGAGLVVRHAKARQDLSESMLTKMGFKPPEQSENEMQALAGVFFERLRRMTHPEHNWVFIYVLVLLYFVAIGPANLLVGRKFRDYRLGLLFFGTSVVFFGVVIEQVGRRGYGEAAAVHSISYARPVGGGAYDVTQWLSAFETRGAHYHIEHPSDLNIYATCECQHAVNGAITCGAGGCFRVDIPLYSAGTCLYRGRLEGREISPRLVSWQEDQGLKSVVIDPGPGWPEDVVMMNAIHLDWVYPVVRESSGRLVVRPAGRKRLEDLIQPYYYYGGSGPWLHNEPEDETPEAVYKSMAEPLMARDVGAEVTDEKAKMNRPPSADQLVLFVLAESPEGFHTEGGKLGKEEGCVLYRFDLWKDELGAQTDEPPAEREKTEGKS
jgi:hypothetical protein